ncbi:MAG TPA: AroM family protein [Stellaceae bacterium]|nr:AroM family protein [Stellaceae bacterium]
MRERILGTLTIGQAPRPDVAPIVEAHLPPGVRCLHRGVLDGMVRAEIDARYKPERDEPELVTRLADGSVVLLSRARMQGGLQRALSSLEDEGCSIILILCTGSFEHLETRRAWLIEPDRIIPGMVAGLVQQRQLGIVVPIASQIASEAGKWGALARQPIFAAASPYTDTPEALADAAKDLQARGADAVLLDCIGFTERHRGVIAPLGLPVILSNAAAAKALSELLAH